MSWSDVSLWRYGNLGNPFYAHSVLVDGPDGIGVLNDQSGSPLQLAPSDVVIPVPTPTDPSGSEPVLAKFYVLSNYDGFDGGGQLGEITFRPFTFQNVGVCISPWKSELELLQPPSIPADFADLASALGDELDKATVCPTYVADYTSVPNAPTVWDFGLEEPPLFDSVKTSANGRYVTAYTSLPAFSQHPVLIRIDMRAASTEDGVVPFAFGVPHDIGLDYHPDYDLSADGGWAVLGRNANPYSSLLADEATATRPRNAPAAVDIDAGTLWVPRTRCGVVRVAVGTIGG